MPYLQSFFAFYLLSLLGSSCKTCSKSLTCQHSKAALNCNCWKHFFKSLLHAGIYSPLAALVQTWLHVKPSIWDMLLPQQQFQISRLEVLVLSSKEKQLYLFCFQFCCASCLDFPFLWAGQQSGQELLSSLTAFVFRGFVAANSAIQLHRQRPWYLKLLCSSFTESLLALWAVIPGPFHPQAIPDFTEMHFLSLYVISCMRWKVPNLPSCGLHCRPVIPSTDIFLWAASISATSFWQERNRAVCLSAVALPNESSQYSECSELERTHKAHIGIEPINRVLQIISDN